MKNYHGKVAIVTGGASGIGRAICKALANRGAIVIIADIDEQNGLNVEAEISRTGGKAKFEVLDVTDEKAVYDLVQNTAIAYGRLDFMFNNAGISMMSEFYQMETSGWKRMLDINLWGVIHGSSAAYKVMKAQGYGYILNTSSAAAFGPAPLTAAYGMSKHAVLALTTSLHYEAEEFGVRVSAICPAFVTTPISQTMDVIDFDRDILTQNPKSYISAEKCAEIIFKGIEKEKLIITTIGFKKTTDILFTIFPFLQKKLMRHVVKVARNNKL